MKVSVLIGAGLAVMGVAGCANVERSRTLNNPNVPPMVTAQQVCSNCHGIDGNSVSPNFPALAGQQESYFIAQLKGFRSHNRHDPAGFEYMWGLSRNLTDEQIKGLAEYFAKQTPEPKPASDPKLMSLGEQIFEKGVPDKNIPPCTVCHGPQAQGKEGFPRLADQHADYIVKQLRVFQRTDERPEGAVMKTVAHDLTLENMQAVAAYLQSLPVKQP
jgi:cytochrome c553